MNTKNILLLLVTFSLIIFTKSTHAQVVGTPPQSNGALKLNFVSSFSVGAVGTNSAEIVAHDPSSKRLFVVNSILDRLVVLDFSNPTNIQVVRSIDMTVYGTGSQSVAVKNGIVAVAVDRNLNNTTWNINGRVIFFNTNGDFINQVEVGNLPDMVTFSPDGRWVMTANEGEPNDAYTIDPEGSISMIDVSRGVVGLTQNDVTTMTFNAFDNQRDALRARGVRIYGGLPVGSGSSSVSQDLEPEYIAISDDSRKAWVTLQENNAIAVVDMVSRRITDIIPLGLKDHNLPNNSFDPSDQDGGIFIRNWPVRGMYQPDAIAYYEVGGTPYLVTANEGDSRNYPRPDGPPRTFNEEIRVGNAGYVLDPAVFPNAANLKLNTNLGRLQISRATGTNNNGQAGVFGATGATYQEIHALGARSFSIWNANTGTLVFDSGNQFETITATNPVWSPLFNADHSNNMNLNVSDDRSDNKGPEPEGVTIFKSLDKVYAFISLERIGGVMVYDITNPNTPAYVDYINSRTLPALGGDRGAEGIIFIPAEQSPNGNDLVLLANEISATVSVYSINGINRTMTSPIISAQAGSGKVTISWQGEVLADAYEVFIFREGQTPQSLGITTNTSFEAGNLANGTTYFFHVKSLNRRLGLESVTSNVVSARPSTVLGTEEETANSSFQVYPNPTNGSFHISIKELKGKNAQINVLDMSGRLLHQQNISTSGNIESEIDLNLASGIYLLQVNTDKENLRRKLVVER